DGAAFPNRRTPLPASAEGLAIVADTLSDTLTVVDLTTSQRVASLPVGRDPLGADGPIGVAASSTALFVALSYPVQFVGVHAGPVGHGAPPGYVQKLARDDLRVLGDTAVDTEPSAMALSDDHKRLVISHFFQAGVDAAAKDPSRIELARGRVTVVD